MVLTISLDEFRHRFNNSTLGKKGGTKIVPIKVMHVASNGTIGYYNCEDKRTYEHHIQDLDLNLTYPDVGMVNTNKSSCLISRAGSSQVYKRGLVCEHLRTWSPVSARSVNMSDSVLINLFNRTWFTADRALELVLKANRNAAAISVDYCVAKLQNFSVPVLFYNQNIVGYYDDNSLYIHRDLDFIRWGMSSLTSMEIKNAKESR